MDDDTDKFIANYLERLALFSAHQTENCPHCGKKVTTMRKIGRCIYTYPCGCRLWQGQIPKAWRKK